MTPDKNYSKSNDDELYENPLEGEEMARKFLFHTLSFLICLTLGFCFALWITYVAVNVANELLKH